MTDNKVMQVVFVNPPFAPKRELDRFLGRKTKTVEMEVRNHGKK